MKKTTSLAAITATIALALGASGAANAGRYVDHRHSMHNAPELGSTSSLHSSAYGGRATDQPYQVRAAKQPTAEFAVMDVGERGHMDSGINNPANFGGRYTDHMFRAH